MAKGFRYTCVATSLSGPNIYLTKGMSLDVPADNPRNILLGQHRGLKCEPIDIPDVPLPLKTVEPPKDDGPSVTEISLSEIVDFPDDVIERLGDAGFHTVDDILSAASDDLIDDLCEIKGIAEGRATQLIDKCQQIAKGEKG
jgi:hypothetical protein